MFTQMDLKGKLRRWLGIHECVCYELVQALKDDLEPRLDALESLQADRDKAAKFHAEQLQTATADLRKDHDQLIAALKKQADKRTRQHVRSFEEVQDDTMKEFANG